MVDLLSHLFDICYRDLLEVGFIAVEWNVKITCPALSWRLPQPGTFPTALSVQCTELMRTSCIVYIARRAIQSSALRTTERIYIYIYMNFNVVANSNHDVILNKVQYFRYNFTHDHAYLKILVHYKTIKC